MEIAQLTQLAVYGGGVAKHVNDLALGLADRDHAVSIGTRRFEESPPADAELIRAMLREDPYLRDLRSAVDLREYGGDWPAVADGLYRHAEAADVVHVHASLSLRTFNRVAVAQARRAGTPTHVTIHTSAPSSPGLSERMRWLDRQDVTIVAVSRAVETTLAEHGVESTVIRNGVDTDTFTPGDGDRSGILFVGRNEKRKGVDVVFESAVRHDVPFDIVIDDLPDAVRSQPNVTAHHHLTPGEVVERYRSAAALLAPYEAEGLPLTVLEALSCGTPVIATRVPGLREVLDGPVVAWLADRSPESVRVAFEELNTRDRSADCRARAEAFSLERQVDAIEELYGR